MNADGLTEVLRGKLHRVSVQAPSTKGRRIGAVLIILYERDGEYTTVLTQRSTMVEDNKGEMSLPGGAQDSGEDLATTALRETHEEIGVEPSAIELLGSLEPHPGGVNYIVTPFVGFIDGAVEFTPREREVAAIVEIPLGAFFAPGALVRDAPTEFAGRQVRGEYYRYGPYVIWGLTYRILQSFLRLVSPLIPDVSAQ